MNFIAKCVIFILSLFFLAFIIIISYRIGKKREIKKALYRVTFISSLVIIAFLLAPYVTDYIMNMDLYKNGMVIEYQGMHFYTIIDFIEEIIVHNKVLNDLYGFVPTLKTILIDCPQVIFIPFIYSFIFIFLYIIFYPLYLIISHRKKTRKLYEHDGKTTKSDIFSGILSAIQILVIITICLTPVNGVVHMYKNIREDTLEENENICKQNVYIEKYDYACNIIEGYSNSVFFSMSDNFINRYVYDSLTKIKYSDSKTNISNEIVGVAKAAVVLNKTRLMESMKSSDFDEFMEIELTSLNEKDIEIIIDTFKKSIYTKDVVNELYIWANNYLSMLILNNVGMDINVLLEYDEMVKEVDIILHAISYILDNKDFINDINYVYQSIADLSNSKVGIKYKQVITLIMNIIRNIDLDKLDEVYNILKDSTIYSRFIPEFISFAFNLLDIDFEVESYDIDRLNLITTHTIDILKVFKKYPYTINLIDFFAFISDEDMNRISYNLSYIFSDKKYAVAISKAIDIAIKESGLRLDIPIEVLANIENYEREFMLCKKVMEIINQCIKEGTVNYSLIASLIYNYYDSVVFKYALKMLKDILPDAFMIFITGKDFKELVGPYV